MFVELISKERKNLRDNMKLVILIAIAFAFLFVPITTFAESESMIVAARSYERIQIYMNSGDELEFSIPGRSAVRINWFP